MISLIEELTKLREENKRLERKIDLILSTCKQRRAIAIDMAANVAYEHCIENGSEIKRLIKNLIGISQLEHDKLVDRYNLKGRHGQ